MVLGALLLLSAGCFAGYRHVLPSIQQQVNLAALRLRSRLQDLSLLPRLKLLICFFQITVALPSVYNVHFPPFYYRWTAWLDVAMLDWSEFAVPGSCLPGGFRGRLLLRGGGPLAFLLFIGLFGCSIDVIQEFSCNQSEQHNSRLIAASRALSFRMRLNKTLLSTTPYMLFTSFCLCAGTAAGVFSAWTCVEFTVDSIVEPPSTQVPRHMVIRLCECETSKRDVVRYFTGFLT
eukprot:4447287-Prymnesium_polylepis.2